MSRSGLTPGGQSGDLLLADSSAGPYVFPLAKWKKNVIIKSEILGRPLTLEKKAGRVYRGRNTWRAIL